MTIVATLPCSDCRRLFGLTRRQSHPGLVAARTRCSACRTTRRRRLTASRAAAFRLRRRNAESALVHAPRLSAAGNEQRSRS